MPVQELPTFEMMMNPAIGALKALGGSATIEELYNKTIELMGIPPEQLDLIHDPERSGQTEIEYRLGWTRSYLKKYGIFDNSKRGIWSLTKIGQQADKVNPKEVTRHWKEQKHLEQHDDGETPGGTEMHWKEIALKTLLKMEPSAFERLVQRILRESGFVQVEVTGRTGDGGVDGKGIMRIGGLLSFHVIFQCKRYQGAVSPSQVRDFRGAMVGRADKGLLITTGNFTKDAIIEATRDGAPAIDLIDGDSLIDLLRQLELGISVEKVMVEKITIDQDWFASL
jgi:restriction system protein